MQPLKQKSAKQNSENHEYIDFVQLAYQDSLRFNNKQIYNFMCFSSFYGIFSLFLQFKTQCSLAASVYLYLKMFSFTL